MAFDPHANFAISTVGTAPSPAASGLSLTVSAGTGALFPAAPFNATVWPTGVAPLASNAEIVRVTAVVGDVLTIVRAQEGTSARTIVIGDQIANTITVKVITDLETAIPSTAGLISAINVSAGLTSNNLSALTFNNSNGVSFGLTGSVLTATVETNYQSPGAYLTTAALSQDSSKYAGTNGAITGGSITVNTSGVSVNLPAYLTTAMASNRGSDFVQATAVFAGTNASGTIASGGISVSVAAPGAANFNISAGTTSNNTTAIRFADSNGVSFGLNAGTITATVKTDYQSSGAYLTTAMQSNAVTLSNIRVSAGTTSNLLSALTLADGNGLSFGIDAGTITGAYTVPAVPAQTNQTVGLYASSNTTLTSSGTFDARSFSVRAIGSLTAGYSGGELLLSAPLALTTAMASNRGSDFVQATAAFAGTNASGTINSTGISVSVADAVGQSNQTIGLYASSNTYLTSSGTVDARSLTFRGDKSITVGISNSEVLFSVGAYLTTAALSQDSSKYAGTNGAITGGSITVNTSGVSVNLPAYLTTADLSANSSKYVQEWALTGNTAGTTSSAQGTRLYFSGGNSLTISGSSNSIVFSVGNYLTTAMASNRGSDFVQATAAFAGTNANGTINSTGISVSVAAQTNQSAIKAFGVSNTGQTAGNTGVSTGIDWVLAGSNSITLSQSTAGGGPNTVWIQHPAWITTATQSSLSVSDAATSGTLARLAFTNLNGITLSLSTGAGGSHTVVGSYTVPTVTNSSWSISDAASSGTVARLAFTNLNGVTLSLSTGAAGSHTIVGSHNALTSQSTQFLALTLGGNTAGTTTFHASNNASLFLHGGTNITLSGNGSSVTIQGATNAPSPVNFSAGTTSSDLGSVVFSNSNGISFGLSGSTITGTVATFDTVGTATTVYSVASANSKGTVTRWAAEDHRHAGVGGIGISTDGNTAGTSGSVLGTYWLQGGNGVTLSQITSNNGSHTLVISGANQVRNFAPYLQTNTAGLALAAGSWYFVPFVAPGVMNGGRINLLALNTSTAGIARDVTAASFASNTTGTKQQSYSFSLAAALYSMGTGSNSTRLESFWSNSFSFGLSGKVQVSVTGGNNSVSVSNSWSISYISDIGSDGAYTLNQYANNGSTGATNTSQAPSALDSIGSSVRNMLSNSIILPIGFNTTIPEGEYWMGIAWSSTTASAVTNFGGTGGASALMFSHLSMIGISQLELNSAYRNWGSTATTARSQIYLGAGAVYTGAANMAPPTNIAISSDFSSLASQWMPYFNVQYRGLTK